MAEREELILEVEVDDNRAESTLKDIERAADDVEEAFEDTGTAAERAGRAIVEEAERARAEMVSTKAATDALANALGPELSAKADLDSVVADLQRMGLTLEDIRAEADTLAAAMKQVDEVRLQGLSQGVDITRRNMDGLRSSSDQSRSVLANLSGNAAQDLGELGGVVGTLGVGLGQLAEYAVDGNISLSNLAKVAGPMLGVALAATAIGTALSGVKAEEAFREDLVENFRDALRDAQSAAESLRDTVIETGQLDFSDEGGFLGLGQQTEDLLPVLSRLGLSFQDFMRLVELSASGSSEQLDAFFARLTEGSNQFGSFNADADALADGIDQYGDAIRSAEEGQRIFDEVMGDTTLTTQQMRDAFLALQDPLQTMPELWRALIDDAKDTTREWENSATAIQTLADATGMETDAVIALINQKAGDELREQAEAAEAAAEAQREHAESVREAVAAFSEYLAGFDGAASRLAGVSAAFDQLNESSELNASQEVIDFAGGLNTLTDAIDKLKDSDLEGLDLVPDTWDEVLNMPAELGPVVDAIAGFRENVQSEFSQAFTRGGAAEAVQWAQDTRRAIEESLRASGDLTEEQVQSIIESIGLLPEQVTTTIQISEAEQARQTLNDIASLIDGIPPSVQREVALEIIAGDPAAALAIVEDYLNANPAEAPVTPVLDPNQKTFANDLAAGIGPVTITPETDTTVAAAELDAVAAEPRVALILAEALTGGAKIELDAVAAEQRKAIVELVAHAGEFERAMTFATRQRTVVVRVQTINSDRLEGSRPR